MTVKVGEKAPEFSTMAYQAGNYKQISSKDYKGKWIILFFYPRDFTFVCPTEIKGFANKEAEFNKLNAVIIGASTDSHQSHKAWFEKDLPSVKFPILSDANHSITKDYGILIEETGEALRGTFVIDPDGIIQYIVVSSLNVGRSTSETLRVLQALQTGGLCAVDWEPGQENLKKG